MTCEILFIIYATDKDVIPNIFPSPWHNTCLALMTLICSLLINAIVEEEERDMHSRAKHCSYHFSQETSISTLLREALFLGSQEEGHFGDS